ncbi:MAG: MBOAT family protein [Lachnospiraceae bacterium]|nr:MBOAT family protein [Lachnospiraceae bacterium]
MLFSSITFLFGFLPLVLLVYYISPREIRNFILMVFSMLFYAWGEPKYIIVMVISILVGYITGLLTDHFKKMDKAALARLTMILSVTVNLGILFYFKYIGFFTENMNRMFGMNLNILKHSLPLGISFYTFQILSYSVDVYSGKATPQKNIINLAAYITLFPQLIAGPIVRYETVANQLDKRKETVDLFGEGVSRFVVGLGKKVLIANICGEIFDNLSKLSTDENTICLAWICAVAYSLQIYFDFSGYSDMAIGLGKMLGFRFLENFDYPYISKSITEFWRRWHISLSTWFKDYVYIPLGGNRKGKGRTIFNLFIVWFLTGFWHGAEWNFIIWGLYYFVLLMLEKLFLHDKLEKAPAFVSRLYALFFINLGWVIFAYDKFPALKCAVLNMFGGSGLKLGNDLTIYYLMSYGLFFVIAFIAATPFPKKVAAKLMENKKEGFQAVVSSIFILAVLILSTAFLASEAFNPFLYFRF